MKVKVSRWGNSLAVRLPRRLADDLGLTVGKTVDLQRRGARLSLEPAGPRDPISRLEDLLTQIKPGQRSPPFEDWSAVEPPWPDDDWSDVAPTDKQMGVPKSKSSDVRQQHAGRRRKRA